MVTMADDSTAEKPLPRVQEARSTRAVAVATFLRSAIGRAGDKLTTAGGGAETKKENGLENEKRSNPGEKQGLEEPNDGYEAVKRTEEADVCESETASSSGRTDEAPELHSLDEGESTTNDFTLRVDFPLPVEAAGKQEDSVSNTRGDSRWAYCDVLLQPDGLGLGLNLCASDIPEGFPRGMTRDGEGVVTVASFRRLHDKDVGPAEVSGKIQVGDVLSSVDGHLVTTLEAAAKIFSSTLSGGGSPFVLLRFLRHTSDGITNTEPPPSPSTGRSETEAKMAEDVWTSRPDVAMLIRELVVKNQSLEEQMLASRLKQDEQRIQLEQLHTLYAKTQLENWSAFSLPKPLSMRAPFNMRRQSDASKASSSLSTAAARLIGVVNPAQYDVEFAVNAERERLNRQFEQRLEAERRQLQSQHDAREHALQTSSERKIRMLEFGVKQLLQSPATGETTDVSAHVQILRHQLLHRNYEGSGPDDEKPRHDCVLCLLLSEPQSVATKVTDPVSKFDAWQAQIQAVLEEYDGVQAARKSQLADAPPFHPPPVASRQDVETDSLDTEVAAPA